jgi:hypothetical protein
MERDAGWGGRVARDGVRGGEDGSSERTTQKHVMGKRPRAMGRYFRERWGDIDSKQACWAGTCRPRKRRPYGRTPAPEYYR